MKRRLLQATLAAVFVGWVAWPEALPAGDRFFRMDWLTGGLASLTQLVPYALALGAGLLLLTVIWGRVFCGWACPLGAFADLIDWVAGQPVRFRRARHTKVVLLLVLAPAAAGGVVALWLLDPFVLGVHVASSLSLAIVAPGIALLIALSFVAVEVVLGRRGFCRVLCPLGAALGAVTRISTFGRVGSDACNDCGECVAGCPMAALGPTSQDYERSECIHCGACRRGCAAGALHFDYNVGATRPALVRPRRATLVALAGGGAAFAAARVGVAQDRAPRLRPPGAVREEELATLCVRCGACVRACPTQTLVSSVEPVLDPAFFTPELVARRGGCAADCNACGQVCPSGAIESLSLVVKRRVVIGSAEVRPPLCLTHRGRVCYACVAACPFEAVAMLGGDDVSEWGDPIDHPVIDPERCTGCGLCEAACPVEGESAVVVVPSRKS